jgi:hypothetical protein
VVKGDLQAFQDMGPGLGLAEVENRALDDDFLAEPSTMASKMTPKPVSIWVCL